MEILQSCALELHNFRHCLRTIYRTLVLALCFFFCALGLYITAMDDNFEATTDRLISWLRERGVKMSPKMTLVDLRSEGRGRGVVGWFSHPQYLWKIPFSLTLFVQRPRTSTKTKLYLAFRDLLCSISTMPRSAIILTKTWQPGS